MIKFFETKIGRILLVVLTLATLAGIGCGGFFFWYVEQPKFTDATVELGTTSVSVDAFLGRFGIGAYSRFTGDTSGVDLTKSGSYAVTLAQNGREEQVKLHVVDTTAPEAAFHKQIVMPLGYVPNAMDFVESFRDYSPVSVYFAESPVIPADYADVTVTVIVADAQGNQTREDCVLSIAWIREEISLELGGVLTKADILYDAEQDGHRLSQADIDWVNLSGIGTYEIRTGDGAGVCRVTVQDTQGPDLQLQDWHVLPGKEAALEDFVVSCEDLSGFVQVDFVTEPDVETIGRQTVQIQAKDLYGNVTTGEAALIVSTDSQAPELLGLTELNVPKHTQVDFMAGVTAKDNSGEPCEITCDADKLDLSAAGTFYVTYTATDSSGNMATARRKITVEHDQEDTWALVEELAKSLENDPEKLRDYVRGKIGYKSNWGGEDPVWFGFKNRAGNCYVHALCLDALLQYYGYETQLIWVKDKTHYWLLINLEGIGWRHIDPTPSQLHGRYSLMTDQQRLWTLSDRTWDFTAWPAALETSQTPLTGTQENDGD